MYHIFYILEFHVINLLNDVNITTLKYIQKHSPEKKFYSIFFKKDLQKRSGKGRKGGKV